MGHRDESRVVTVERTIAAPPSTIFDILRRPARHAELDGSGMLQGAPDGPELLCLGDSFSMAMRQRGFDYRSVSTIVEYEQDELITWESAGRFRGRKIIGGHWWRYELAPTSAGETSVRHSYVWGKAILPLITIQLPGYPRRMAATMPQTLENLAAAAKAG